MLIAALLLVGAQSVEAPARPSPWAGGFKALTQCLHSLVESAVDQRLSPKAYRALLSKSCLEEEARFRPEGVRTLVSVEGLTQAQAEAQLNETLARNRAETVEDVAFFIASQPAPAPPPAKPAGKVSR